MVNLFDEISTQYPDKICIRCNDLAWTYAEFFNHIDSLASQLHTAGVSAGDRVGLTVTEPAELLLGYYGCFRIGAVPVPIPFKDSERIQGAKEAAQTVTIVNTITDAVQNTSGVADKLPTPPSLEEAMVIFTSGTTSAKLKGVRLSSKGISSTCQFMNSAMEMDSSVNECVYAAIDHAFGFGRCHSVLSIGGTLSLLDLNQRLSSLFEVVVNDDCNALATPPSILSSLLRMTGNSLPEFEDRIKWVQTGAMKFDQTFRTSLISTLPKSRIFLHYGLSEAMRVTFFEINQNPDKLHTEGPPSAGVELQVFDENKEMLASGEEGDIGIRGTNLCLGYLDEELWQSCCHDGWFITSDRGRIDEDGFLEFCGRSDDTINANGTLIHPDEIESKIQAVFPELSFSIVGIPDPLAIKDKIIVMYVEDGSITLADVKKGMVNTDQHLVPQKMEHIARLPKTRSGKVNRAELLRAHLASQH